MSWRRLESLVKIRFSVLSQLCEVAYSKWIMRKLVTSYVETYNFPFRTVPQMKPTVLTEIANTTSWQGLRTGNHDAVHISKSRPLENNKCPQKFGICLNILWQQQTDPHTNTCAPTYRFLLFAPLDATSAGPKLTVSLSNDPVIWLTLLTQVSYTWLFQSVEVPRGMCKSLSVESGGTPRYATPDSSIYDRDISIRIIITWWNACTWNNLKKQKHKMNKWHFVPKEQNHMVNRHLLWGKLFLAHISIFCLHI